MTPFDIIKRPLHLLPPETAHRMAISALAKGLLPAPVTPQYSSLSQRIWGLTFSNPVGMAAGFDKNAEAIDGLVLQGFGFVEVGTVTPKPQQGNARPRLFRLAEDEAVINRLGMPGHGMEVFVANLKKRKTRGVAGANIGRNKDTADTIADYVVLMQQVYAHADYIAVNISSPNTEGLRKLQEKQQLKELLVALMHTRTEMERTYKVRRPLLVKIAPDLDEAQKADIVEIALAYQVDGLIVSNTTITRPSWLASRHSSEQGGLSGKPLFALSTQTVWDIYKMSEAKIPLIGVGGIASGEDAWNKMLAGASLVQLYTAFIYQGFGLVQRINRYIAERMQREGVKEISDIVGMGS